MAGCAAGPNDFLRAACIYSILDSLPSVHHAIKRSKDHNIQQVFILIKCFPVVRLD